jgi:hypoxanthine phosphoribosyltransferase
MKKVYYTWSDIQGAVLDIARQLQKDNWRPDYIVGITRGGAVPAVLLSQYLEVPMRPLEVSLRDGGQCVSDCSMAEDAFGYIPLQERQDAEFEITHLPVKGDRSDPKKRKNILIVDDINDSGATIEWIKNDWPSSCLPMDSAWNTVWHNNVRVAVLTNNLSSNQDVDYSVFEVNKAEDDVWLVYPWEEFWRG